MSVALTCSGVGLATKPKPQCPLMLWELAPPLQPLSPTGLELHHLNHQYSAMLDREDWDSLAEVTYEKSKWNEAVAATLRRAGEALASTEVANSSPWKVQLGRVLFQGQYGPYFSATGSLHGQPLPTGCLVNFVLTRVLRSLRFEDLFAALSLISEKKLGPTLWATAAVPGTMVMAVFFAGPPFAPIERADANWVSDQTPERLAPLAKTLVDLDLPLRSVRYGVSAEGNLLALDPVLADGDALNTHRSTASSPGRKTFLEAADEALAEVRFALYRKELLDYRLQFNDSQRQALTARLRHWTRRLTDKIDTSLLLAQAAQYLEVHGKKPMGDSQRSQLAREITNRYQGPAKELDNATVDRAVFEFLNAPVSVRNENPAELVGVMTSIQQVYVALDLPYPREFRRFMHDAYYGE